MRPKLTEWALKINRKALHWATAWSNFLDMRTSMNLFRILTTALVCSVLSLANLASPVQAATMNPGDFSVSIAKPSMKSTQTMTCSFGGQTKTIDPSVPAQALELATLFGALRTAGSGSVMDCVFNGDQVQTGVDLTGTVSNTTLGLTGTIEQTCDLNHETDTNMRFSMGASQIEVVDSSFVVTMSGFQSCSWVMTFTDGSKLAGTIKQVINLNPSGGTVTAADGGRKTYENSVTMNADVLITGGAGKFAAMAGNADFSNVSPVKINIPNPNGGGPSMFIREFAKSNQIRFANSNTGMSGMTLNNSKGGSVDFAIPAQSSSKTYTFGKGADGREQEIRVTTAPNAKCTLTVTGNGNKSATLVKDKKTSNGEFQTTISASDVAKKLKSTEAKLKGKKGTMTASCTAGKNGKAVVKKISFTFADV